MQDPMVLTNTEVVTPEYLTTCEQVREARK